MAITPEKRSTLVHLLNTGTASEPVWSFINEGVTELTEELNADTNDLQYIGEDTQTTYVRRYGPSISLSAVMIKGDPVNDFIQKTIDKLPVGSDADTQYIRFSMLNPLESTTTSKKYRAFLRNASISVDDIGGSAGDEIEMNVTLSGRGEQTEGVVTVTIDSVTGKAKSWEFTAGVNTTALKFIVKDNLTNPISNATVTLCGYGEQKTPSNGEVNYIVLQNGTYLYSVSASSKTTVTGQVVVGAETTKEVEVTLANS